METALVKHATAAHDEVQHLIGEFMTLARATSVPTPTIDRLLRYYEPEAPLVPDGRAEIPLDWREIKIGTGMLAAVSAVVGAAIWLSRRKA
jgi:hypothetical protein